MIKAVEIYRAAMLSKPPFHNRMIKSVYEVSRPVLGEILTRLVRFQSTKHFWIPDILEGDNFNCIPIEICLNEESVECLLESGGDFYYINIFDADVRLFTRFCLEIAENVSPQNVRCGELEIYGGERDILVLHRMLCESYDGFFVLDSSKKHLEEIL